MSVAGSLRGVQAPHRPTGRGDTIGPALEAYLRDAFGYRPERDAASLEGRMVTLANWGTELRAVGFHAPEHSYLRGLFTKRRLEYLTDLLDRPELLTRLPRYRELQEGLGLARPVDRELQVALETIARLGNVPDATPRFVRDLQGAGYRFASPDLDLLAAAVTNDTLWRAVERPDSIRAVIVRRLRRRAHVNRATTDLDEGAGSLERMSRVDFLRITVIQASLEDPETVATIVGWLGQARADSVESGGVIAWQDGKPRWHALPSASPMAGRYRRPPVPQFAVELAGFHLHATDEDDAWAAGPSLMDALSAAYDGRARVVITDLGDRCFDVDYYRDAHGSPDAGAKSERLRIVDLDLGVYTDRSGTAGDAAVCGTPREQAKG